MLIRAYSDLHGFLPHVKPCDAVLIAGDICPITGEYGDHEPKTQARWLKDVFLPWSIDVPADYVVMTPGNHDAIFEARNKGFHYEFARKVALVVDETVEIDSGGPRVFCQPWIPNLAMWPFYKPGFQLEALAELIPGDADIWMFHGPPMRPPNDRRPYALDQVRHEHVGNRWVTDRIINDQPQLVVCGHIHEGFGLAEIGDTPVANVAFVDEKYAPRLQHLEIDWHEARREITGLRLVHDDPRIGLWWNCVPNH